MTAGICASIGFYFGSVREVIRCVRTARFSDLVKNHPIPERAGIELSGLALMNGFGPDETVPQGTFLKVLQVRVP